MSVEIIILRLVLAMVLGSLIGLEREVHNRPAGFRTHILVSVGAALFTLVSVYGITGGDPGRIAAQIVSGIGFLGAGTILREGANIKGLTTAASLWTVAGIGMASGAGYYLGALIATGLMLLVLLFFSRLEKKILQSHYHVLEMELSDRPGQLGTVASLLGNLDISIVTIQITGQGNSRAKLEIGVKMPPKMEVHQAVNQLAEIEGVYSIKFEEGG